MCERNIHVLLIQVRLSLQPVADQGWRWGVLGSLLLLSSDLPKKRSLMMLCSSAVSEEA